MGSLHHPCNYLQHVPQLLDKKLNRLHHFSIIFFQHLGICTLPLQYISWSTPKLLQTNDVTANICTFVIGLVQGYYQIIELCHTFHQFISLYTIYNELYLPGSMGQLHIPPYQPHLHWLDIPDFLFVLLQPGLWYMHYIGSAPCQWCWNLPPYSYLGLSVPVHKVLGSLTGMWTIDGHPSTGHATDIRTCGNDTTYVFEPPLPTSTPRFCVMTFPWVISTWFQSDDAVIFAPN